MEGEQQIGKYLVAGPAVYRITGVTPQEVITVVLRPERRRPPDWPADRPWTAQPEVRWPRRMLRLALKQRELRLVDQPPTEEEVGEERKKRLGQWVRRASYARESTAVKGEAKEGATGDEWSKAIALSRQG